MRYLKSKFALIVLCFAGVTSASYAGYCDPCDECVPDIEVGIDFLFWTPCIKDQHFALTSDSEGEVTVTDTHYLCNDWESGTRVYAKLWNWFCGFNGALVYDYINPKTDGEVEFDGVVFSVAQPQGSTSGNNVTAKWEMEYQTLDALLSCSIEAAQNRCLSIEAFTGLTWIDVEQKADYTVASTEEVPVPKQHYNRQHDFWAVGPCFGINTSLTFCDCFNLFGSIKTSFVVGESRGDDVITNTTETTTENNGQTEVKVEVGDIYSYPGNNKCVCFPGLHLTAGIEYELCFCDTTFALGLGWEYVQWINAPTFFSYEQNDGGVRSSPATKDLSMQGIFVGISSTF